MTMPLTFTLDDDEKALLLLALGFATATAHSDFPNLFPQMIALTNKINANNPNFTPYEVPKAGDKR
jgi:hypothetical protein